MNSLKVGYARVDITPMRGIGLAGYFKERPCEGVLDALELCALALEAGGNRALVIAIDNCHTSTAMCDKWRAMISERCGVRADAVIIHCTHSHTSPYLSPQPSRPEFKELIDDYIDFVEKRMIDASLTALEDLLPARMGIGVGRAPNIAFVRRYRMKNGMIYTNPGVNNPDIVAPIGDIDDNVNLVRFDREGGDSIALCNLGCHPDTVGGNLASGDWPSMFRRQLEKSLDNVRAIFINGAEGDINHVNVHPAPGFLNDTFNDFDDVSRGYGHARYMGRVVAGAALQVWDKVEYLEVDSLKTAMKTARFDSNRPRPEDMPEAKRIHEMHMTGRDAELPFKGMMLTTKVAEAGRMVRLENGPDYFDMTFSAITLGPVAIVGIPGEPFNAIGKGIKQAKGFKMVIPGCLSNGSEGYFPTKDAYDEGGYEALSSRYGAGVGEKIIKECVELAESLA